MRGAPRHRGPRALPRRAHRRTATDHPARRPRHSLARQRGHAARHARGFIGRRPGRRERRRRHSRASAPLRLRHARAAGRRGRSGARDRRDGAFGAARRAGEPTAAAARGDGPRDRDRVLPRLCGGRGAARATARRRARAAMGRAVRRRAAPGLWRFARYFWPHLRGEWLLILGSFAALFAEVALQLLEPWPLKLVLDHVLASPRSAAWPVILNALDPTIALTLIAIGLVAIAGLRALASYANTVGFALVGNRVLTKVRSALFRHLQYLSLSFHTRARSGELALRVMSDVSVINDVVVTALLPLFATGLVLCGMVAFMFWLHWQLAVRARGPRRASPGRCASITSASLTRRASSSSMMSPSTSALGSGSRSPARRGA